MLLSRVFVALLSILLNPKSRANTFEPVIMGVNHWYNIIIIDVYNTKKKTKLYMGQNAVSEDFGSKLGLDTIHTLLTIYNTMRCVYYKLR